MSAIKLSCTDQALAFTNLPIAATGGVGGDSVEFTFCSLWDGFTKAAFFFTEDDVYEEPIDSTTGVCVIPFDVLAETGKVRVGVLGVNANMVCRSSVCAEYIVLDGVVTAVEKAAMGGFVRYDEAQSLTDAEQQLARDNIGVATTAELVSALKETTGLGTLYKGAWIATETTGISQQYTEYITLPPGTYIVSVVLPYASVGSENEICIGFSANMAIGVGNTFLKAAYGCTTMLAQFSKTTSLCVRSAASANSATWGYLDRGGIAAVRIA